MKTGSIRIALLLATFLVSNNLAAQDTQSSDGDYKKIERLAFKWYGEGTKIKEVKEWKSMRITAQGYDTDGERSWLVLFPETPIGKYNAYVVPMAIDSKRNDCITMSEEARKALLSISKPTVVSGVSVEKKLNDFVLPYLLQTGGEKSEEWTQGTYYYFPAENVREYLLDLKAQDPGADAIPRAASVYLDENGFLIHRKITGVLTISRGKKAPMKD